MKIWKFYRKRNNDEIKKGIESGATTEDIHPLMAFTNIKEIRDEFVSQRDMTQYIEKVSKGIDNDDWKVYANDPNRRGQLLQYYTINTRYWNDNGEMCITNDPEESNSPDGLTVLATPAEISEMETVCDNISAGYFTGFTDREIHWPSIFIFKRKTREALYRLGYETAWKMNTQEGSPMRGECIYPEGYDPNSDWEDITCDEFEVFTRQMLDWFKK